MSVSTSHDARSRYPPSNHALLLEKAPNEPSYTKLASSSTWGRGPRVEVAVQGADQPLAIPIAFLERSGDNTWRLVHHMISTTVNEEGIICGSGISGGAEGAFTPVDLQAVPTAGEYQFLPSSKSGPEEEMIALHLHTLNRCRYLHMVSWPAGRKEGQSSHRRRESRKIQYQHVI